jgi:hypothetical protein
MNELRVMNLYRELTGETEARARNMYIFLDLQRRRVRSFSGDRQADKTLDGNGKPDAVIRSATRQIY